MEALHQVEVDRILQSIRVVSPVAFACGEKEIETKPGELLKSLQNFLYRNCYVQEFRGSSIASPHIEPRIGLSQDLVEEFRKSRAWPPCRDFGWRIDHPLANGELVATKAGSARRFGPGHYIVMESQSGEPKKDQRIGVLLPRVSQTAQEGYFYAYGEAVSDFEESYNLVRFYWNVTMEGAPRLLALLTKALDRFQVPFHLKLMRYSSDYFRRDSAVLYVNQKYLHIVARLAGRFHGAVREYLREGVPLFTKSLAFGMGLAECPGESFGVHRSQIFAQALWSTYEQKLQTPGERLQELARQFQKNHLDLKQPHLNPGSRQEYAFHFMAAVAS